MLIYDRKEYGIDLYTIKAQEEKLKEFKKSILEKYNKKNLFYTFYSNNIDDYAKLTSGEQIKLKYLYDNPINCLKNIDTCMINICLFCHENDNSEEKINEKLKDYIEGKYDFQIPSNIYFNKQNLYFLPLSQLKIFSQHNTKRIYKLENMINLPKTLYLLHLLKLGSYDKLISENIEEELKLFDINYLKTISYDKIKEMIETGLVKGSLEEAKGKAEVGSKILRKLK